MARELRIKNHLKQRQVAERIGIKPSSYGNLECSPFKVVGRDKVVRMGLLYKLTPLELAALSAAWERCPLSPYGEKQKKHWERRNRMRSKAKHHDRIFLSLLEVLGTLIPMVDGDHVCSCGAAGPPDGSEFEWEPPAVNGLCEVCSALENLGLSPYTTKERVIAELDRLQCKLEAKSEAETAAGPAT